MLALNVFQLVEKRGKHITGKTPFFYGYIVVIICFLAMVLTLGLHAIFGLFFKPIIADLGWTRAITSGAFSLSMIVSGVFGIVMGRLNDRFGPRLVMTLCGLFAGLGYLLLSQTQAVWQLYLFCGIMLGIGNSVYAPLLSTVARWFVRRRSMMTGIVFAGSGVGWLILPPVIIHLISTYGWRTTYLILGSIVLIVVVISAQFLKRDPSQVGQVVYGGNNAVEGFKLETKAFSLKEAMLNKPFWLFCGTLICYGFSFFSLQVHIVPYATDLGISAARAATILTAVGGATIIGQIGLGSAGDKIGSKRAFLIGIILVALAVFTLLIGKELWAFFLVAAFLGMGFGDCSTVESPLAAWLYGLASHGVILGFFGFTFSIGAAIGPALFGYIFDVTGNYQLAFLVSAIIAIVAVILTTLLKPPSTKSSQPS